MIPNSMHCVYLGVVKQFLALTESPAGSAFHNDAQAIDVILLTIKQKKVRHFTTNLVILYF
jgi:hypothetical protein